MLMMLSIVAFAFGLAIGLALRPFAGSRASVARPSHPPRLRVIPGGRSPTVRLRSLAM